MKFKGNNVPQAQNVYDDKAKNHVDAKVNRAGGLSYSLDSATKLLTMTGGQFFNEPSYYTDDKVGVDGLTELARDVVDTAKAVTASGNPNDILSIAHWLRVEKNIRTTPAVLYAIAAGQEQNRNRMVEYGPKILKRPDDVMQAFVAYFGLYGSFTTKVGKDNVSRVVREATMPNSFKKGLAAAIAQFDEYQLLKYENNEFPRWKDVLQMVYRKNGYPVKKELLTYFLTGNMVDPAATPILAARKELAKVKTWNSNVPALAKKAHIQWDQLLSQFGNTKAVWEAMVDGGKATLPVMAAVRNLRNMEQAGISDAHWRKLTSMVLNHEDNKMMPFRFVSARKHVSNQAAKSLVDALLDKASQNLADLPGVTLIVVDHSGSMDTKISDKSEMTKKEAGTALAAVLAKKLGNRAIVAAFGSTFATVEFSTQDSTWRIYEEIMKVGRGVGYSTEAYLTFEYLLAKRIKVDRVILLSDMQCYERGGYGNRSFAANYERYRKEVNNNAKLVSVDIGGYGDSTVAKDKNVYLSTGFTESIVNEIVQFEGLAQAEVSTTPSLDYVRANY